MTLVEVLVNRRCTHCVGALDRIADLAGRFGVAVAAVDVATHPEAAEERGVRSSPALVVDDDVACFGVPDASTFAGLVGAGPEGQGPARHPHPPNHPTRDREAMT